MDKVGVLLLLSTTTFLYHIFKAETFVLFGSIRTQIRTIIRLKSEITSEKPTFSWILKPNNVLYQEMGWSIIVFIS